MVEAKNRFCQERKFFFLGRISHCYLVQGQKKRDDIREQIAAGIDPAVSRKTEKAKASSEGSFELVGREWHSKINSQWSEEHAKTIMPRLERDVFPYIGIRPVEEISSPEMLAVIIRVESRSPELAKRVKSPAARSTVTLLPQAKPPSLREAHKLTGQGRYVFPSARSASRPMSNNTVNAAMRRMRIDTREELTGHGFRAMARTILDEVIGFRAELIEHQLAHAVRDPLGRACNRTTHLPERKKMMQAWADRGGSVRASTRCRLFK